MLLPLRVGCQRRSGDRARGAAGHLAATRSHNPARRAHERQRWFRRGQRWRVGCEGRISLKRRHGLRRRRYRGADGTARWVGLGVIANNLMSTATFVNARVTRSGTQHEIGEMKRLTSGPAAGWRQRQCLRGHSSPESS
jgi:hypothetical protein